MIKAVVFDLDHTLFDRYATLERVAPMFREAFAVAPGISDALIAEKICEADRQFVHHGWEEIHQYLIDNGVFSVAPDFESYREFLLSCFRKVAVPFPFTLPTLHLLREQGYSLGLITNGRHEVQESKLKMLSLTDAFDAVVISGDHPFKKPDAEIFRYAARSLGVDISEMMYVGDHPLFDVDGSRRAGAVPVWVRTTGTWIFPELAKPPLQVDTVEELPALLEQVNK